MPYITSQEQLEQLTAAAIKDEDIVQGLRIANLRGGDLYSRVNQLKYVIWDSAKQKISAYDEREPNVLANEKEIAAQHSAERPLAPDHLENGFTRFLRALTITSFVSVILAVLLYGLSRGWKLPIGLLFAGPLGIVLGSASALLVIVILRTSQEKRNATLRNQDWLKQSEDWEASLKDRQDKSGLTQLRLELQALKQEIDKTVTEKIKGELRGYLNSETRFSYETKLKILRAPGLAEVFDKSATIDTAAKDRIQFMLQNMPGGSIGIAGSRGAGKTTLLRLFCGKKKILDELKQLPVLGVLVSAPVEYQARDFILYLFSATCRSFLDYKKVPYDLPGAHEETYSESSAYRFPFLTTLRPLWGVCLDLGMALIVFSLYVAIFATTLSVLRNRQLASERSQVQSTTTSPTAANAPTSTPTPSPSGTPSASSPWLEDPLLRSLRASTGIVWTSLWMGLASISVGIVLIVITGVRLEEYQHYWRRGFLRKATRPIFGILLDKVLIPILTSREEEYAISEREKDDTLRRRNVPEADKDLTEVALEWLSKVKFQQSYTSGWSGAIKLPIGVEGGVNRARTLAENQLSLPEIVDAFIRFLNRVSNQCQLIIGIDELDKLESDEKAHRFLNEIKSVFGLERCFYLISVSENAMSSFERRGLPFRDVFDSSFDTIVYVDYLDFAAAQELIEKRIVGQPIPFFALSYCLSGGLARDMIRIFRDLIEVLQRNPAKNDLETLCKALVTADLHAKLRAAIITSKRIDLETEVDSFLEEIYKVESSPVSAPGLLKSAQCLFPKAVAESIPVMSQNGSKDDDAKRERLNSLKEELATYIYYLLTIFQFFKNSLSQSQLTNEAKGATVNYLAKARQMLVVNPTITRNMLDNFRRVHGLTGGLDLKGTSRRRAAKARK